MIKELTNVKTSADAMSAAGLDWDVSCVGLMTDTAVNVNSHKAICRNDNGNILGIVGSGYCPVKNSEAFAFFDEAIKQGLAEYSMVGCFGDGKKVFIQANLKKDFDVGNDGDIIRSYLTLVNSHNGSTRLHAYVTPVRIWCQNKLIISRHSAIQGISVKHTANINKKIIEAINLYTDTITTLEKFELSCRILSKEDVDDDMVENFLEKMFPTQSEDKTNKNKDIAYNLFESGTGNKGKTAWHLYNGYTEYIDHYWKPDMKKESSQESIMFGSGAQKKEEAYNAIMEVVGANNIWAGAGQ